MSENPGDINEFNQFTSEWSDPEDLLREMTQQKRVQRIAEAANDSTKYPQTDATGMEENYIAPATPTEQKLEAIWAELLGLERVSIHDDFFRIGGNSLLAMQLLSRMCDAFQMEI